MENTLKTQKSTYNGLQIVIQEDKAKELANEILDYFEEE